MAFLNTVFAILGWIISLFRKPSEAEKLGRTEEELTTSNKILQEKNNELAIKNRPPGTMTTSLIGCKEDSLYCPSPVIASSEVKEWLKDHEPLPAYMRDYLKAVGDEQEVIKDNCK
jgi:hypothetical protein